MLIASASYYFSYFVTFFPIYSTKLTSYGFKSIYKGLSLTTVFRYNEGEIHFNLMAIVSDRKSLYEKQVQAIRKQIDESGMETDSQQAEIARLQHLIEEEELKMRRYRIENIRRKHNYLPLIVEILKILAKEGKLMPLYEKAKESSLKKQKAKISS